MTERDRTERDRTGRDWAAAMRRALTVDGGHSGVPMLLALCDERPTQPTPAGPDADGNRLAKELDACRAALVPHARDGDLGAVITVLATVARAETDQP